MRIALVSDLHGNMTAVEALEKDLSTHAADEIWCLGDLVGKGPSSDKTFDWAMRNCSVVLGGNWDYGVGRKEFHRDSFYHRQLGQRRLDALSALPREKHVRLSGRNIRVIHGRPVMGRLLNIQDSRDALAAFLQPDFDMLIYADCHRQGARTLGGQIINVGSVGNALGLPMVQYALLDGTPGDAPAPLVTSFVTLPYDNQAAAQEARAQPELPDAPAYIQEVLTGVYAGSMRKSAGQTTPN
ncbi:MAG: metallophosphoesterase family protein [Clostridiales bacterium]|nr:metallophosphoesterase family protein [Clostridiales bacterium]